HRFTQSPGARPGVSRLRRVAGDGVGPRGGAVHAPAGFPPARPRLAASFRGTLRAGGAGAGAGVLAAGDGAAESSGRLLRVRPNAEGLRLSLGPGAGALDRARGRRWRAPAARAASPGGP